MPCSPLLCHTQLQVDRNNDVSERPVTPQTVPPLHVIHHTYNCPVRDGVKQFITRRKHSIIHVHIFKQTAMDDGGEVMDGCGHLHRLAIPHTTIIQVSLPGNHSALLWLTSGICLRQHSVVFSHFPFDNIMSRRHCARET